MHYKMAAGRDGKMEKLSDKNKKPYPQKMRATNLYYPRPGESLLKPGTCELKPRFFFKWNMEFFPLSITFWRHYKNTDSGEKWVVLIKFEPLWTPPPPPPFKGPVGEMHRSNFPMQGLWNFHGYSRGIFPLFLDFSISRYATGYKFIIIFKTLLAWFPKISNKKKDKVEGTPSLWIISVWIKHM